MMSTAYSSTATKPTVAQQVGTALDDLLAALEDALRPNPTPLALRDARHTLTRYQFDRRRLISEVEEATSRRRRGPDIEDAIDTLEEAIFEASAVLHELESRE